MATLTLPQNNSRIPLQSTSSVGGSNLIYPTDLVTSTRDMYMNLTLNHYGGSSVFSGPTLQQYLQISLPVPVKINEQQTVSWEQASITSMGAAVLSSIIKGVGQVLGVSALAKIVGNDAQIAAQAASYIEGETYNPFLVMLFKTQNFKEHVLQWVFAPNNSQDTNTLHNIIEYFKAAQLPSIATTGLGGITGGVLNYPDIIQVAFNIPAKGNGQPYLFNYKPCAITSVFIDWSGAGVPAFFINGSPAVVSIVMQLKEIELWFNTGEGTYG